MSETDNWRTYLTSKQEQVSRLWLSRGEFEEIIDALLRHLESPLRGLQFSIEFEAPFEGFEIGRTSEGEPDAHSITLDDNRNGRCRVRWWLKESSKQVPSVQHEDFARLFEAWWKPKLRTPSAGLPDLKRVKTAIAIADFTVARRLEESQNPAVLFCDLDNFGMVNKQFNQETGDRVIKEFGALAETVVSPFGVLLHNGGDELIVLSPRGGALAAIRGAYAVRQAVTKHNFKVQPISLGMSSGAAATDAPVRWMSFQELKAEADFVLHNHAKKPKKGRARFKPVEERSWLKDWSPADFAALAKSLVLSAASVPTPFGNVWLDALSSLVSETATGGGLAKGSLATVVDDFIAWVDADGGMPPLSVGFPPDFLPASISITPVVTPLAVAFAIAHGVLSSPARAEVEKNLLVRYSEDGHGAGVCLANGTALWSSGAATAFVKECQLPLLSQIPDSDRRVPVGSPRAVLIKIGHSPLPVPAHLFKEVVVVDDRPARGGCLPDFWEVTIARLVACVHNDPNICAVFVIGDHAHGAETVARLRSLADWAEKAEEMASRLSVTVAMLREAMERLTGRIHFPQNYQELVRALAAQFDSAPPLQPPPGVTAVSRPLLPRELRLASMALGKEDGCRVETAAQAFPVVLEILRKAEVTPIRDQAGRMVRELVDFKVQLIRPEQEMIPDYYRGQEERMKQYFQGAFLDTAQFFGKALRTDGQLDAVLGHVANIIQQEESAFATRRAILVVPHDTKNKDELAPLGLVSVRIMPRFSAKRCELSYSFTWRTVEALVGFPYSLYGSVRYGQELTQLVRARLPATIHGRVAMGQVSYLAHSLHMFMDDHGQAIVRHIVNDATD